MKYILVSLALILTACSIVPKDNGGKTMLHDPFVVWGVRNNIPANFQWYLGHNEISLDKTLEYSYVNLDLILEKVEIIFSSNTFPETIVNIYKNDVQILSIPIPEKFQGTMEADLSGVDVQFLGGDSVSIEYDTRLPTGVYNDLYCNIMVKCLLTN